MSKKSPPKRNRSALDILDRLARFSGSELASAGLTPTGLLIAEGAADTDAEIRCMVGFFRTGEGRLLEISWASVENAEARPCLDLGAVAHDSPLGVALRLPVLPLRRLRRILTPLDILGGSVDKPDYRAHLLVNVPQPSVSLLGLPCYETLWISVAATSNTAQIAIHSAANGRALFLCSVPASALAWGPFNFHSYDLKLLHFAALLVILIIAIESGIGALSAALIILAMLMLLANYFIEVEKASATPRQVKIDEFEKLRRDMEDLKSELEKLKAQGKTAPTTQQNKKIREAIKQAQGNADGSGDSKLKEGVRKLMDAFEKLGG